MLSSHGSPLDALHVERSHVTLSWTNSVASLLCFASVTVLALCEEIVVSCLQIAYSPALSQLPEVCAYLRKGT